MPTFTILITDDRYAVPTMAFVEAPDVASAVEIAEWRLGESRHHRSIEVREDDMVVATVVR
jgi:hypothetical protein